MSRVLCPHPGARPAAPHAPHTRYAARSPARIIPARARPQRRTHTSAAATFFTRRRTDAPMRRPAAGPGARDAATPRAPRAREPRLPGAAGEAGAPGRSATNKAGLSLSPPLALRRCGLRRWRRPVCPRPADPPLPRPVASSPLSLSPPSGY
jgi:hypothetical protein